MSKQDTNSLRANAATANGQATGYGASAASRSSILTPTLNRMATAPQGYTPGQLNNFNTAALQSVGGSTAGTVGAAMNRAAATNNAGGANAVSIAAGHDATSQLSDAALGVQNQNAQLQQEQQQNALRQLGALYGEDVGASQNALGLSTQATVQANNAANNGFWRGISQSAIKGALMGASGV